MLQFDFLKKTLDKSNQAIFFCHYPELHCFYANHQGIRLFSSEQVVDNQAEAIDIAQIFSSNDYNALLLAETKEKLRQEESITLFLLSAVTNQGDTCVVDVQAGFLDASKEHIFLELTMREDNRLQLAYTQVGQGTRPQAILNFDENFSIFHCNSLFYQAFSGSQEAFTKQYGNNFLHCISSEQRDFLYEEVQKALQTQTVTSCSTQLITLEGERKWFLLEFQRRCLEEGQKEKLLLDMVDIDRQLYLEREYALINRQFDALQELSDDLLFRINVEEKILIRRKDRAARFGLMQEEVAFPDAVISGGAIHPDDVILYEEFAHLALSGQAGTAEVRMKEYGKDNFGFRRLTWVPMEDGDGVIREVFGKLVDVQTVRELEQRANFDALTSALNKRAMLECTSKVLNRSKSLENHGLFFVDLDDFKSVNDNLGHTFGDYLLGELGKRLRDSVRAGDLVGRVGGDEFLVFLKNTTSTEAVLGKAKMLLSTISEDFVQGDIRYNIHGSIGIAIFPDHGKSYEELYHHADLALYASKGKGKNTVTLFSEDMKK